MTRRTTPAPAGVRERGRRALREAWDDAWQRLKDGVWPVLQQALAVTVAWWVAVRLLDHHVPYFAPIAALVALNTPRGRRGANALRVVLGVIGGVVIGELAFTVLGTDAWAMGVAVFAALLAVMVVGGQRVTRAQAGVSAVIAVAAGQQAGIDRVLDVLVGGGVALAFSQLIFPAHPLALLRRAESAMLEDLADVLTATAKALEASDPVPESRLWERLRPLYAALADLRVVRDDTIAATKHTPAWWGQQEPVRRERAAALRLDLLGNSCLTLAREATTLEASDRAVLVEPVRELGRVLRLLSKAPGNRAVRRRAVQRALDVVAQSPRSASLAESAVWAGVQLAARDVLVFSGASPENADEAVRSQTDDVAIGHPARLRRPPAPSLPSLPLPSLSAWPARRFRPARRPPGRP
ncbi:FUSC family protein [Streptomyces sp. NPDC051940]|uniref:FUSC family protein n=1 Tax=Streptomyces sp. NPDC051940 TaxID=3155675 RepID=UPI00343B6AB0